MIFLWLYRVYVFDSNTQIYEFIRSCLLFENAKLFDSLEIPE